MFVIVVFWNEVVLELAINNNMLLMFTLMHVFGF
jgi:hypothetical protein